jgi:hypothetical protein
MTVLLAPLQRAILPPVGSVVNPLGRASLARRVAALFAAKSSIQQNAGDVSLVVIGDSTGNETTEWVYLFAQWLATQYLTHSVSYRLWNDAGNVYDAAVAISTGSGSNTIRIWNASISGTQPLYLMGAKLSPAVTVTPAASLVVWNHGKNLVSAGADSLYRGGFIQGMDQVRRFLPGVAHAALRQSPNRDDNNMAPVVAQLDSIAHAYNDLALVDVYWKFIAAAKSPTLYLDNLHPSSAGSQLFLQAMQEAWTAASIPTASAFAAFVSSLGTNLLTGITKFSDPAYTGGLPSGWANTATTMTADATVKDAGAAQSMKFVNTSAGANIYQQLDATALRGKTVTLAVRQYVPTGMSSTTGRIAILVNNGASVTTSVAAVGNQANDGWRWLMIAGLAVPSDAVFLRAILYCDTATNVDSTVYFDRAIFVAGDLPRNIA